jgi:hypothetical protein
MPVYRRCRFTGLPGTDEVFIFKSNNLEFWRFRQQDLQKRLQMVAIQGEFGYFNYIGNHESVF